MANAQHGRQHGPRVACRRTLRRRGRPYPDEDVGVGTRTTAAAEGDTDLETPAESRATGTPSRAPTDDTNDTYQVVGTITMTSSRSITEVGIFSAPSGGTLFSRSVFAAETVGSGNSLQVTYQCDFDRP